MRFCWHDWHDHKLGSQSLRSIIFLNPPGGITTALFVACSIYWSVAAFVGTYIAFLIAMTVGVVMTSIMIGMDILDQDPWRPADRTCLKCGKVEFNYSRWKQKDDTKRAKNLAREQKRAEAEAARQGRIDQANSRFEAYKAFWEKANA